MHASLVARQPSEEGPWKETPGRNDKVQASTRLDRSRKVVTKSVGRSFVLAFLRLPEPVPQSVTAANDAESSLGLLTASCRLRGVGLVYLLLQL